MRKFTTGSKNQISSKSTLWLTCLEAFTADNICSAFRKTGVVPFNPNKITETMMGPSLATSTTAPAATPVPVSSPVRTIARLLYTAGSSQKQAQALSNAEDLANNCVRVIQRLDHNHSPDQINDLEFDQPTLDEATIAALQSTASTSFLFSPLRGSATPPPATTSVIIPTMNRYHALTQFEPETDWEWELIEKLLEAQERENQYKLTLSSMQATVVLQNVWVLKAKEQLQAQQKPKKSAS
ncbi:hypothetical protein BJ165DRAFT_1530915 [Panaeolus papilionaceus]|nr:hypothetical protein BJ165DRAFT_1530915 [Panaeolus papilionaceus]